MRGRAAGAESLAAALACCVWCCAARADDAVPTSEAPSAGVAGQAVAEEAHAAYEKPRSGWAAIPIATYAPETTLGLGAFGTYFFRLGDESAQTRPSSASIVGLYTLREQFIGELIPELHWDADRSHLWSKLDYRHYPNKLWAIGPDAPDSSEESFTESRSRLQARVGHAIRGPLFLYGHLEVIHVDFGELEPDGMLVQNALPGSDGGRTVGLGPGFAWDSRDHLLVPHTGSFHSFVLMSWQPIYGSRYEFTTLVIDLRKYLPIGAEHTLALNARIELQDGDVPFYKLAQLGGDLLRGYFEGRLRDKTLLAVQAEYRLPLFWRIGAVGFAGLGGVSATFRSFPIDRPAWSVGGGLRLMLNRDEKLNLRADAGVGEDTFGLYVSVGEAF